jgi:hypothetical protein
LSLAPSHKAGQRALERRTSFETRKAQPRSAVRESPAAKWPWSRVTAQNGGRYSSSAGPHTIDGGERRNGDTSLKSSGRQRHRATSKHKDLPRPCITMSSHSESTESWLGLTGPSKRRSRKSNLGLGPFCLLRTPSCRGWRVPRDGHDRCHPKALFSGRSSTSR